MKKPKINLKTIHTGHQFIDVEGVSSLMVCNAYYEMIDALIDAYYVVDPDGSTDKEIETHKKITNALQKAGVEI